MNPHERREFFYSEFSAGAQGAFFFLGGAFFVGLILGHLLGLIHVKFDRDPADVIPFIVFLGLVFMLAGLWMLSKAFDRRPVIVMDSEGLFYRPHGEFPIPWRDIQTVKRDKHGNDDSIILSRNCAPQVIIDLRFLYGDPIYDAIMKAWQSHGGASRLSTA
jgi:hypothetical protein